MRATLASALLVPLLLLSPRSSHTAPRAGDRQPARLPPQAALAPSPDEAQRKNPRLDQREPLRPWQLALPRREREGLLPRIGEGVANPTAACDDQGFASRRGAALVRF